MKKLSFLTAGALLLIFSLSNCTTSPEVVKTTKFHPSDPFQKTLAKSQYFEIDASEDHVIEGKEGTRIVIPKGSFKNANGSEVSGKIKLELAEGLSLETMVTSNLTTTSDGKPLQTDGMIYINATANNKQLVIDKNIPLYIEIPTTRRIPGMMVYKGERDSLGNMNWIEPRELEKFLTTVDLDLLNFYPSGFEEEVFKGLPFRNHQTASKELTDSLYYSLSTKWRNESLDESNNLDFNETYYDTLYEDRTITDYDTAAFVNCGIDPATIKVIKNEKFQNTLIATREFETRLQSLFRLGNQQALEIYINNLDKNLWELDSMVALSTESEDLMITFDDFAQQKLTNVKGANRYAALLKTFYEEQLSATRKELEETKEIMVKELQAKAEIAKTMVNKYKVLIGKREKYRMEAYGFQQTSTGWINIDMGTEPKFWGPEKLEVMVENGKSYNQINTYIFYYYIKSLYRLNTYDNELFYVGNGQEKEMLMPKNKIAVLITIAFKGDTPFFALQEFQTSTESLINMSLHVSTMEEINQAIKPYNRFGEENSIEKDLEFMTFFAEERKRITKLQAEQSFMDKLAEIVYPCMVYNSDSNFNDR